MMYCEKRSVLERQRKPWDLSKRTKNTHRNKEIRNLFLIARPRFAVLPPAPGDISARAVDDHDHEEDEVEPGERTPARTKKTR
jgi:hypothetical protein